MLGSGEGHALLLGTAVLVREENHQVLAAEVLHQLVGQTLQSVLIRYGTFTGSDDHKHMVVVDVGSQLGQFIPVSHKGVFRPHV